MNAERRASKRLAYIERRARELRASGNASKARRFERRARGNALRRMFDEHLDLLRSGACPSDPRRVEIERRMRLALSGPPVAVLSDEARRRAIEWFGEGEDGER